MTASWASAAKLRLVAQPAWSKPFFVALVLVLLLLCFAAPAAAEGTGGLALEGCFTADLSRPAAARDRLEPDDFLSDLGSLYAGTEIGAREALVWLGAVALMVRHDQEIYDRLQGDLAAPSVKDAAELLSSYFLPVAVTGLVWLDDHQAGLRCAEAMAFACLNAQALKWTLGMARPYTGEGPVFTGLGFDDDYCAMPSGHTAVAFALATVLGAEHPRHRWLFYTAAILVGLSRIALEEHWPSNVLAGAVLGLHAGQTVLGREFTVLRWEF